MQVGSSLPLSVVLSFMPSPSLLLHPQQPLPSFSKAAALGEFSSRRILRNEKKLLIQGEREGGSLLGSTNRVTRDDISLATATHLHTLLDLCSNLFTSCCSGAAGSRFHSRWQKSGQRRHFGKREVLFRLKCLFFSFPFFRKMGLRLLC